MADSILRMELVQRATDVTQQDQRQLVNIHQGIDAWRRSGHALVHDSGEDLVFVHCHAPGQRMHKLVHDGGHSQLRETAI